MGILQGTIPDDWEGEYCRYAVCWPNSPMWLAVLRGVLTLPARGRFWDEHTGTITEAQSVIRETFDNNLHLEEVIMSCNDTGLSEIAAALRLLALAQQQSAAAAVNCCGAGSSGNAPAIEPPLGTIEQGNPFSDPPPEGFDSWEEFQNDKCAVANDIVNQLQASLERIGVLNFGALSLDALGIALAVLITLAIPAEVIIAIAALLISVVGEIIVTTLLSIVNDNEADLVCQLFSGSTANDSSGLFQNALAGYVDAGVSDPLEAYAIKTMARYMVNASEVNRLYIKDLTKVWPSGDCSGCAVGDYISNGWAVVEVDGAHHTITSEFDDPIWRLNIIHSSPSPGGAFIVNYTSNQTFGVYHNLCEDTVLGGIYLPRNEANEATELPFDQSDLDGLCIRTLSLAAEEEFTIEFDVEQCV